MKKLSATAVHREFVDALGSDAITYSTGIKYLRSASFEVKGAGSEEGTADSGTNFKDDQILHALEISPFGPIRQIARMTLFLKTRVYRPLTELLNFVNKKLYWVPHSLSEEQKRM
jgi:hypothetical protein